MTVEQALQRIGKILELDQPPAIKLIRIDEVLKLVPLDRINN